MSQPTPPMPIPQSEPAHRRCRGAILVVGVGTTALAGLVLYAWLTGGANRATSVDSVAPSAQSQPHSVVDDVSRRMLIGSWQDDYQGKRTMDLKADGTGTMVVELSGWRASLSAPRLRFDMVWSVEGGRLKKQSVGGEPETQVQLILKTMGDRVSEPILELTDDRLLLLDQDGKTKYDWRRAKK